MQAVPIYSGRVGLLIQGDFFHVEEEWSKARETLLVASEGLERTTLVGMDRIRIMASCTVLP